MTGGFVYRGSLYPVLYGWYVFADYGSNNAWTFKQSENPQFILNTGTGINQVESFGEDDNGELYALSYLGSVYAVSASGTLDVGWTSINATESHLGNRIDWAIDAPFGITHFQVQRAYSEDFTQFVKVADVAPDPNANHYHYDDPFINPTGCYYRIAAYINDGSIEYSPLARILPDAESKPVLSFDVANNKWRINLPEIWQEGDVVLYDIQGKIVYDKKLTASPLFDLPSPGMPGCYFIVIRGSEGVWSDRIISSSGVHN